MSRTRRCSPGPRASTNIAAWRPQIGRLLAPGGLAAIEIGFDQAESVAALFAKQGLLPVAGA